MRLPPSPPPLWTILKKLHLWRNMASLMIIYVYILLWVIYKLFRLYGPFCQHWGFWGWYVIIMDHACINWVLSIFTSFDILHAWLITKCLGFIYNFKDFFTLQPPLVQIWSIYKNVFILEWSMYYDVGLAPFLL